MSPPSNQTTAEPPAAPKVWTAGTLTYSSAGLAVLFFWLLFGDFAWSMRERSVGPMAQWYLTSLNVSNIVFGLLISSFPAVISVILGPLISVKSDRHRGPRGRRIPFLLVTTPLAAFGMIGLGLTPVLSAKIHAASRPDQPFGHWMQSHLPALSSAFDNPVLVSLLSFGVFWAAFEIATVVSQAVFSGLINDVVPRPLLGRFYGLFRAVHLIDGMIFNFWIMGHVPQHFTLILTAVGVLYGLAFGWVCFKVREGSYPPPPPAPPGLPLQRAAAGVRDYCRESFSNPYYLSVFVLIAAASLVFLPVNTFAIPYAKSLGVDMDTYGKFLALTYLISLVLSFFLGWLADVFHPIRMAMATLACYLVVTAWGALFASTPGTFLFAWVAHGVLSGSYMTGAASLSQRLFPQSKYAQFASAAGIVGSLAHASLAPLVGLLIDRSGNLYRYTFAASCALAVFTLVAAWTVYRGFVRLGGPKNYVAPE